MKRFLRRLVGGRAATEVPAHLTARLEHHERLGTPHLRPLLVSYREKGGARAAVKGMEPDLRVSVAVALQSLLAFDAAARGVASQAQVLMQASEAANALAARKLPVEREDVELLLHLTTPSEVGWFVEVITRMPLRTAERWVAEHGVAGLEEGLAHLAGVVDDPRTEMASSDRAALRARVAALVPLGGPVDVELIDAGDAWGVAARERVRRADPAGLAALLLHLAAATKGPSPSGAWERRCAELLAAAPAAAELLRGLLDDLEGHEPRTWTDAWGERNGEYLAGGNEVLARGVIWAAAVADEAWSARRIARVATSAARQLPGVGPRSAVIASAGGHALGRIGTDDAISQLVRLRAAVRHASIRKQLDKAIATAAEARGSTPGELAELAVPTHGVAADATHRRPVGDAEAVLEVTADRVELRWVRSDGREVARLPSAAKAAAPDAAAEVAALRKRVAATHRAERRRLEGLFAGGGTWEYQTWLRRYLDHPITGPIAEGLLWAVDERVLLPDRQAGTLHAADGEVVRPVPDAVVSLWHPAGASADAITAWRARLDDLDLVQPIRQVWREVYLLTPVEEETHDHTNRFAAHILRAPQFAALTRERGWEAGALGYWDGGQETSARKPFGPLVAEFDVYAVDTERPADNLAELASTDRIRFVDDQGTPVALRDVPPLVFSEALRDVDLFVSVSSIGADPTWIEGARGLHDVDADGYWRTYTSAALGQAAAVRREALERLLPRLRIADRVRVDDRWVRVDGVERSYRIHIGSGAVFIEPDDRHLCIVPQRGAITASTSLRVPFEGDGLLGVIVSKALLLAADDEIEDQTIRAQLDRRA